MKMWNCEIDDPRITDMDPVRKLWMFNNWIADQNEQAELAKSHAYLLASFDHPDAVKQAIGEGNTHSSNEEEFEESLAMVKNQNLSNLLKNIPKENKSVRRRRRKIQKG